MLDYGNVMIHLFDPDARGYWDLEGLWGDAPRVVVPGIADGSEAAAR